MRLLYVAVAIVSAFTGYVVLEAKPIEVRSSVKAVRPVLHAKEVVTRQVECYEPESTHIQLQASASQKSCCPGNSSCTNISCRSGKSQCSGKSCGCGR